MISDVPRCSPPRIETTETIRHRRTHSHCMAVRISNLSGRLFRAVDGEFITSLIKPDLSEIVHQIFDGRRVLIKNPHANPFRNLVRNRITENGLTRLQASFNKPGVERLHESFGKGSTSIDPEE